MGKAIFHPKDTDLYVEWSSVVDAPTAWGTYDEMLEYLVEDSREKEWYARPQAIERLSRARETGTSSISPLPVWLSFQNTGRLAFEDLEAFIDSYNGEDGTYDESLLELYNFEDD